MEPIRIALVVGHEPEKPGAEGRYLDDSFAEHKVNEYAFNTVISRQVRDMLYSAADLQIIDIRRHIAGGYSKLPGAVNATKAHFALELHFNAFGPTSTGTETLYWHRSQRGRAYAGVLQRHLLIALGLRDRGLKPIDEDGRGGYFLKNTAMPALIAEPFFASNPQEMQHAMDNLGKLAAGYAAAIREIAGLIREGGAA